MRKIRRVELDDARSKGITAVGDDAAGISNVQHVALTERVGLKRDVKLLRELVVPGQPVPLKIVITPSAVIDGVGNHIDAVIAAVALPPDAGGDGRSGSWICGHGGTREHGIRERVGSLLARVP